MVQRKSLNKLGIQADSKNHVKSEKRSMALKPSSSQHQDIRNRGGTELKKKMKKSRSIKISELEGLRSSPMGWEKSPKPVSDESIAAATPQKPSLIKIPDFSPNYMKPTSSSDARKERLQVSPHGSQASYLSKSPNRRTSNSSKSGSASGHKPVRTLTKTSSLKPVRTLTKTSSMKHARSSMKKSPGVGLCSDLNVERATCSSTLKDSKFPAFVMLHPGGTESEGTSVMKVCPYTYCSLNGHHHAPLPPLKHFLTARRRLLKTQKSMKLKGLSTRRAKPPEESKAEIDTGQMAFNENFTTQEEASSTISLVIDEVGIDFFVEIYAKPREDAGESIGRSVHVGNDEATIDVSENFNVLDDVTSVKDGAENDAEIDDEKYDEGLPDESSYSEISFQDNLNQNSEFPVAEMNTQMTFPECDQLVEVEYTDDQTCLIQSETGLECSFFENESEEGSSAESELDESVSDATDMDWEEGQVIAAHLDDGADYYSIIDDESNPMTSPKFENPALLGELVFKPDDIASNSSEEFPVEGVVLQQEHEENTERFSLKSGDDGFESDGGDQSFEIDVSSNVSGEESDIWSRVNHDLLSPTGFAFEESTTFNEETYGIPKPDENFINDMVSSASVLGDDEPCGMPTCSTDVADETLMTNQESSSFQVDAEMDQVVVTDEIDAKVRSQPQEQEDAANVFEKQLLECVEGEKDQNEDISNLGLEQAIVVTDVGGEAEGKEQVEDANALLGIQFSDPCQGSSETNHDTSKEDDDASHLKSPEFEADQHMEDDKWGQHVSGEGKMRILSSTDSEEHGDSERNKSGFAENSIGKGEQMLVEDNMELDAAETIYTENNITSSKEDATVMNTGSNSNQLLPKTCSDRKGAIRCRRPVEDYEEEELRKFNPREPRYLPIEPDPEAEKVDLRHQMMDERKNAEEWMLDYALQQAVTKLAPARKRKVALLVEAFEAVIPPPKCENHLRHTTAAFAHARPIQACN